MKLEYDLKWPCTEKKEKGVRLQVVILRKKVWGMKWPRKKNEYNLKWS